MVKEYANDWELDEGGLPDDFDFTITSAEFGYEENYKDQTGAMIPLLKLHGTSPDVEIDTAVTYSLGSGWEPTKGGKEIKNAQGKHVFTKTSMIGRLIERVTSKEPPGLGIDMAARGSAKIAAVWVGLSFHMKREEFEFKGLLQDKGGKSTRLMPVTFLGDKGKGAGKAGTENKSAAGKGKAETGDVSSLVEKKLTMLAKKLDKTEFQKKAMDMDEVVENDDLMTDVLDDSADGFWARANVTG